MKSFLTMRLGRLVLLMGIFFSVSGWPCRLKGEASTDSVSKTTVPVYMQSRGQFGTFWSLQRLAAGISSPPLPFNPFPELNVITLDSTNRIFLIDDESVDYPALDALAANDLAAPWVMSLVDGGAMSAIEEGGGESQTQWHSSDELWLEFVLRTNATGWLVIHPPEAESGNAFDLYCTTNLSAFAPGLNGTNWQWVLRCNPGQTNLIATNLTAKQCYFILGRTNDSDGDGLSTAFENLVAHFDSQNADQNTNGIPDGWEWNHFGSLQPGDGDYDDDGADNLYEFQHGSDPNTVLFWLSATNLFAKASCSQVQINILRGVPSSAAVLVDSTNVAEADWTAYDTSNLTVNLGSTEGWHKIRVGLRGRLVDSQQVWQSTRLKLDVTPPCLAITSPAASTLSVPLIQLKGWASEPLSWISYDLTNAAGSLTNQQVLVVDQYCDTNIWEFTTNYFQAFDVALTNGVNIIAIHATDQAGNTAVTNFSFTLDYSNDTNAPAIQLGWPQNGARICASNFTWRGWVDDPTANVLVSVIDAGGMTNSFEVLVEREGNFWAENIPLSEGTNVLNLFVSDAANNVSSTNITVINLPSGLTVDPVSVDLMGPVLASVSGTIGLSDHTVWVNGVRATQTNGTWVAADVPARGGTVVIQARAIPNSDNGGNGSGGSANQNPASAGSYTTEVEIDRPSFIYLASYEGKYLEEAGSSDAAGTGSSRTEAATRYGYSTSSGIGGEGHYGIDSTFESSSAGSMGFSWHYNYGWPNAGPVILYWSYSTNGPGTNYSTTYTAETSRLGALGPVIPHPPPDYDAIGMEATRWQDEWGVTESGEVDGWEWTSHFSMNRAIKSQLKLWTGGKSVAGSKSLFRLRAGAVRWIKLLIPDPAEPWNLGFFWLHETIPVRPPIGQQGPDGDYYAMLADGQGVNASPNPPAENATMTATHGKSVLKIRRDEGTTVINDKTQTAIVGQRISLNCALENSGSLPPPEFASTDWTVPGYAVAGYNPTVNSATVISNIVSTGFAVDFYWVDGGTKEVSCKVVVAGVEYSGRTGFVVQRPTVTFTDEPPSFATNDVIAGTPSLSLGTESGFGGMSFRIDILSANAGRVDLTQLINRSAANGNTSDTTGGKYWLDNMLFYMVRDNDPEKTSRIFANTAKPLIYFDGPAYELAHSIFNSSTTIFDQFKTYVMFRPDAGYANNNIFVPLGKIVWAWSAATTYSGGSWSIPTYFVTRPSFTAASLEFPQWNRVLVNH
jgi:hypothetical protein